MLEEASFFCTKGQTPLSELDDMLHKFHFFFGKPSGGSKVYFFQSFFIDFSGRGEFWREGF
jgi:hypothetical protein